MVAVFQLHRGRREKNYRVCCHINVSWLKKYGFFRSGIWKASFFSGPVCEVIFLEILKLLRINFKGHLWRRWVSEKVACHKFMIYVLGCVVTFLLYWKENVFLNGSKIDVFKGLWPRIRFFLFAATVANIFWRILDNLCHTFRCGSGNLFKFVRINLKSTEDETGKLKLRSCCSTCQVMFL